LRLLVVTVFALAALTALLATRPAFSGDVWSHGDDLAFVTAWTVATLAVAWLFVVTGSCLVALGADRPRLARRLATALPPEIRRLLEVAIVTACVALPAVPAGAATSREAPVVVHDQPVVRAPVAVAPADPDPVPRTPVPTQVPAAHPAAEHVVVRAGDNLWLIARAALERTSTARVDDSDVARYWRTVIDANRSTLRSGDPSLIFPGEIVTLPPAPRGVS
jgi:nucleoid-associated protein YgaU